MLLERGLKPAALGLLILLAAGCAAPRYAAFSERNVDFDPSRDPADVPVRALPMFDGRTGAPIGWRDLLTAVDWAGIVIIGEQHDDGIGHAVQLAIYQDAFNLPHRCLPALSMEMLERDEQILVDDYLEDIIDQSAFIRLTFSANWGGEGKWIEWYQPIVDVARDRGALIVAANAPRRYVRLARTHGYERLRALSPSRRVMFDFPRSRKLTSYRDRFGEVMREVGHASAGSESEDSVHDPDQERRIEAAFRSQILWDATMADSIVRARPRRNAKVVHLVGQFHSDFEGGLVQEIRARAPRARILTISMHREWRADMRSEDRGRADIIIYTGERPPVPDAEDNEAEES